MGLGFSKETSETLGKVTQAVTKEAKELAKDIWKALTGLLDILKKGGTKLRELFDKISKSIVDWFLKNKKLISFVDEIEEFLIKFINILRKNLTYLHCIDIVKKNRVFGIWMAVELEAMIKFYTGNVYQILNKALRGIGGVKMTKEFEAMQKVLDAALEKLPSSVYNKGILKRSLSLTEEEIKKLFKVGKDFTEKGFMSTTYSEEVLLDWMANNPADNVILKVMGKNGKLIEDASLLPHECEVLFKSNTTFVVESVRPVQHPLDASKEIFEIIIKEK